MGSFSSFGECLADINLNFELAKSTATKSDNKVTSVCGCHPLAAGPSKTYPRTGQAVVGGGSDQRDPVVSQPQNTPTINVLQLICINCSKIIVIKHH